MGIIPARLMSPRVGLIPTIPFADDGQTIEPSVSDPTATVHKLAEVAAPDPELDPQALRSSAYGFLVSPPRPLHPLVEWLERMFAHSLRLVLPSMIAPASRSFRATPESCAGREPASASDPAVVCMRSAVSMLSLISTGIPCMGPRGPFCFRSLSSPSAMASASGFTSITLFNRGPDLSISPIRAKYAAVKECAESSPDFMRDCRSDMVASSNRNGLTGEAGAAAAQARALESAGVRAAL